MKPAIPRSSVAEVFGLTIQGGSVREILTWAFDPSGAPPKWIVTANPENLLEVKRNPAYAIAVKQADYVCVDGFGLWLGLRLAGTPVTRVTGVELAEALIQRAADTGLRVGFIGGAPRIAEKAAARWKQRFPHLQVCAEDGGRINADGTGDAAEEEAVHRLVLAAPAILLVAFGDGRSKQEAWIARRLADLPSVKIIVGVGGTFDFWVGRITRAPAAVRMIGLEWAWRLLQEPRRWKRILRATCVFPVAFVAEQLRRPGPMRKSLLYSFTLVLRILFFLFVLGPAISRAANVILAQGIRSYRWSVTDLIIPFVVFMVLYPVGRFLRTFIDKPKQVE